MKYIVPFILFTFAFSNAFSQNNLLELSFTGQEGTTSTHVSIDSVFIRNITQNIDTMLTGNDTTLLLNVISGIKENSQINKPFKLQQNYPNPFRDRTTFAINVFQKENLDITLFDIYGQKVAELNESYETGTHLFTISGNQCQFYILNVTSKSHSSSIKLTNSHPSGNFKHSIVYTGNQPIDVFYKVVLMEEGLPYVNGDELLFIGYADAYEFSVQYDSPENSTDYTFQFEFINTFECGEPFTDNRDGKVYETKKIDRQCWMTENLKIGEMIQGDEDQMDNEEFEKYCYNNNVDNCENYGGLYQWDEMMQYDTARFTQGICPQGWHLPTIEEWNTLIDYYGGPAIAGDSLKLGGNSGYNALMSGYRNVSGNFGMLDNEAYYWTSVYNDNSLAYYHSMTQSGGGVSLAYSDKQNAYSVRCLKGLPVEVNADVITIDSAVYVLISDSLEIAQGVYKYEYSGKAKANDLIIGDVIVGVTGDGYLRKVSTVTDNPPFLTLETSQATMEDVFNQGEISFDFNLDDLQKNSAANNNSNITFLADGVDLKILDGGFTYTFDDVNIYDDGNLSLKITNGSVEFDPNFKFDFQYKSGVVKKLEFYADKALLKNSIDIELICQVNGQFNDEITLATYEKSKLFWIGYLPVLVKTTLALKAISDVNLDAQTSLTSGYTNENNISIGTRYENGQWSDIWDFQQENTVHPIDFAWSVNLDQKLSLIPEVTMEFYTVAGPYFNIDLYEQMQFNHVLPSHDIDANFSVGLDANVGANVTIFGKTLASYNKLIPGFNYAIWNLPDELQMISGNNQTGPLNQQLVEPIEVKVVDNYGNTFSNIPVHFEIISGGGTLSEYDVMTNDNGLAETNWTMGGTPGENILKAKVVKVDGTDISGSPMEFTASAGSSPVANFTGDPIAGFSPLSVIFTDQSINDPTSWQWDFGDGNTSTQQNPEYIYEESGNFTVTLTVSNPNGSNTEEKIDYISVSSFDPCPGTPTVTDIDGNIYNTVQIGTQCWMAENLKTTTYQDGTSIPNVTDAYDWKFLTSGAYVWYDNDSSWKDLYGGLYNWYTTTNENGLCPSGWHVPEDDEFTTLTDFIGGETSPYGNGLKSCRQIDSPLGGDCNTTEHPRWDSEDTDFGTNTYSFTGLPAGFRGLGSGSSGLPGFWHLGDQVNWWSTTWAPSDTAYSLGLYGDSGSVFHGGGIKKGFGFSVRCLKD